MLPTGIDIMVQAFGRSQWIPATWDGKHVGTFTGLASTRTLVVVRWIEPATRLAAMGIADDIRRKGYTNTVVSRPGGQPFNGESDASDQ